MSTFREIINSVKSPDDCYNKRIQLIRDIEKLTGRRLLVYAADINKPKGALKPEDKTGFSDLLEGVEGENVDILINSGGGFAEVTEVIVGMLRNKFKSVRFSIPNMAKSAATLLVLSGDKLLMDERSELGPIDPQVEYTLRDNEKRREAAEDILEGFKVAKDSLAMEGPEATPAYIPLLDKYTIGLLRGCKNAIDLSRRLATEWLGMYMFRKNKDPKAIKKIVDYFATHSKTLSHGRAIGIDKCLELGLDIVDLRKSENAELRNSLWELWCLYELHFERSPVHKIYENSSGCRLSKQSGAIPIIQMQGQQVGKKQHPAKPQQNKPQPPTGN